MRVLVILFLLLPHMAMAGAWAREKGTFFLSTTIDGNRDTTSSGLYLEYGLTETRTVGVMAYGNWTYGLDHVRAFMRVPLLKPTGRHRIAYTTGFGKGTGTFSYLDPIYAVAGGQKFFVGTNRLTQKILTYETFVGLHWGMGLENGWVAADAFAIWNAGTGLIESKLDLTYGMKHIENWMFIAQMQLALTGDGSTHTVLAPSAVRTLSDTFKIELGLLASPSSGGDPRMKVAIWAEF